MPSISPTRLPDPSEPYGRLLLSGLLNALAGLLLLALMASMLADALGLSGWAVVKSAALYVGAVGWLSRYLPEHLPHERLHPANQVTLLRLVLTALIGGWAQEPLAPDSWAPTLAAGAVLTLDGLDGWLARRGGWASPFGARFDMETDAILVLALAALAWGLDRAGPWVLLGGLARYLFVGAAQVWNWLERPLPPSRRRQGICVLLVLALLLAVAPPIPPTLGLAIAALGTTLVGYSFAVDAWWLWRRRRLGCETAPAGGAAPRPRGPHASGLGRPVRTASQRTDA